MIDSKNSAGEPGPFNLFTLAVAALAISATVAAIQLTPAEATSRVSATATYAGPSGYFPDEYVNQAKEIEAMPEMYY